AFLASECGGDDGLRIEVTSLLDSASRAGSSLREIVVAGIEQAKGHGHPPLPGLRVAGAGVGGRVLIERIAGGGGMGAVYRATDRTTGASLAVKMLQGRSADTERFAQEASLLAELQHPAIVRYVAHGRLADGQLFLAMEWLDGETLEDRLEREPLGA